VGSIQFTGPIHRLSTLTLGLVGFGRIAQEVARRMEALVGEVVAYDPYVDPDRAAELGVEMVELSVLLDRSDVVSLHVPLNPVTQHLIGEAELERMKSTAFLVNTSRGQVVDEGALIAALEPGRIAGAALDVVATEPLPDDSPLRALPNVVLTPHFANYSVEAVRDLRESVAHAVGDVLAGRWPAHVVNEGVKPRVPLERV
jgi:D-3-phosphoglycerate dehydrogenase